METLLCAELAEGNVVVREVLQRKVWGGGQLVLLICLCRARAEGMRVARFANNAKATIPTSVARINPIRFMQDSSPLCTRLP